MAGYYKAITHSVFQECLATYTCVMPDKLTDSFLPSSRSIAFKKTAWEKGKYPEDLDTCEDLVFAKKLKKKGLKFVVAKNAIVYWPQRENIKEAFLQFFSYAKGDGKAGYIRPQTPLLFLRYALFLFLLYLAIKQYLGIIWYIIAFGGVAYILWSIAKNYKYVKNKEAIVFLPLLQITADVAVLSGTFIGFFEGLVGKK